MAVIDFLDRGWRLNAQGLAFVDDTSRWTFDDARTLSNRIAHALLGDGLGPHANVVVLSPNDARAWICVLGIWRAGLSWVPLNPAEPAHIVRDLIDAFDCELLFYHSTLTSLLTEIAPALPKVKHYICIDDESDGITGSLSIERWASDMPPSPPQVDYAMDDVVAVAPTGGTTGTPKGVMNTHRSISASAVHLMLALHYPGHGPIVNLAVAPMTHASGFISVPATARGGTVVITTQRQPHQILEAIEAHNVTELFLPPTLIYRLLSTPGVSERDYSSLRYMLYGAAPMSTSKLIEAIEVFGPVMTEIYGQMEAPCAISFLRPEEHFQAGALASKTRLASCGRPYPLIALEIRGHGGASLAPGESGEICLRGDLVMKGYYRAPERTSEAIVDGWLHTGDIGHVDDEGYLYITDRKKDMIVSGGLNIYPSDIEQVIWRHPAVQDCAVIGVPHDDWGEAVKAVVELNPGAQVTEEELIQLCKEQLGRVQAPKSIDFVTSLPRSPNGKVLKKDVREPYWQGRARRV